LSEELIHFVSSSQVQRHESVP